MKKIEELIRSGDATIIDVRTNEEFMDSHVAGSINIPVQDVPGHLPEIRNMKNIILCCASGGRSGQATHFLRQNGVECENGGSWMTIDFIINR